MYERPAAPVIVFDKVAKNYGALQVLSSLSLSVYQGEVYGFLGRNGAGKSTAIKMMPVSYTHLRATRPY